LVKRYFRKTKLQCIQSRRIWTLCGVNFITNRCTVQDTKEPYGKRKAIPVQAGTESSRTLRHTKAVK